jgi:hypothetical protein
MGFLVKVVYYKRKFSFMNNLYYKLAVASVSTALSFVLGASEEVKAATITVPPTIQFGVRTMFGVFGGSSTYFTPDSDDVFFVPRPGGGPQTRLAEFNISSFFIDPNTIIKSAIFQDKFSSVLGNQFGGPITLSIFGYIGNGTAELSDADNGVFLSSVDILSLSPGDTLNFDVTAFVNQRVSNGNPFAGFAIKTFDFAGVTLGGTDALGRSSLVIETVDVAEPVPEPTTIFGSALALGVGGWLKRKKSGQENKTTSH